MIDNALASGADEVIIDLEDAVAPAAKDAARATVAAALGCLEAAGPAVAVRINPPGSPWCHRDVAAVANAAGSVWGIVVPKVESPGDLHFMERLLSGLEAASPRAVPLRIEALLETARGIAEAKAIAGSSERLAALVLGYGDLAASLGRRDGGPHDQSSWLPVREAVLIAARAHGLQAIDGPTLSVELDEVFARDTRAVRDLGWDGRWAIHPRQVAPLIDTFTPDEAEVHWARRVVEALSAAQLEGRGVVALDGQMLDEAILRSAVAVLARSGERT
jgi:citrate lyase subunit beta/citryl-CoA lyase